MRAFICLLLAGSLSGQVSLQLGSGSTTPQGTISLPLSISTAGTTRAAGTQWTLFYSPRDVASISVSPGPAAIAAAKSISCAGSGGSYTCLATGINKNLEGDGVLAIVTISLAHQVAMTSIAVTSTLSATLAGDALTTTATGGTVVVFAPKGTHLSGNRLAGVSAR